MGAFGAFGKMPSMGDFFHFGLKPTFLGPWDRWLQERLSAARLALGDDWQQRYFSAPIWRFSLTAGLAGTEGMIGVLMPSVDRVGRHFPLTLAAAYPAGRPALKLHFASSPAFEALEDIALGTLEGRSGSASLEKQLGSVRPPAIPGPSALHMEPGRLTLICDKGQAPESLAERVAPDCQAPSIWSCLGQDDTRLMIVDGLPNAQETLGLFDLTAPVWAGNEASVA